MDTDNNLQILTEKELEVFRFLVNGKINKEISSELFISPSTVNAHIRSIYSKLNVSNRTELLNFYYAKLVDKLKIK